jgi:hypothetical protein
MKTLAELRAQFPQYQQVSDGDFLMGLHRKLYPTVHPRKFMDAIDGAANAHVTITRDDLKQHWRDGVSKPMDGEMEADTAKRLGGTATGPVDEGGGIGTAARSALQGLTFGAGDEIVAAGTAALGPNSYGFELERERQRLDQGRQNNPGTALASEVGGALALPLGALDDAGSLAMRIGKSAGLTGALSSAYGFLSGEGGAKERAENALTQGAIGGGIGAAIPVIGTGIQRVANARAGNRAIAEAARNAPSTEELRAMGTAAYQAVDDAGVAVDPGALRTATDDIVAALRSRGLDEGGGALSLTPQSARLSQVLTEATDGKTSIPFREIDQLRRKAGIPAGNVKNKVEASLGSETIARLDDFVNNLDPSQVVAGNADNLAENINAARDAWRRMSKSQLIDDAIEAGGDYLSGASSGIRNQFKNILRNPRLSRGFTEAEKAAMRKVVNGSLPEQMLNLVGGGLGQLGQVAAGGIAGGIPGAAIGAGVAAGTRKLAESVTSRKAEVVRALMANGGLNNLPVASPTVAAVTERLMRRGTAPSTQPR